MPPKTLPPGPSARVVAANVRRYREAQNIGLTALSRRIGDLGHEVLPIGLRRIENEERRVTVDDLTALAMALGVSPTSLLTPAPQQDDQDGWQGDTVELTGVQAAAPRNLWHWVRGDAPAEGDDSPGAVHEFTARAAVCRAQLDEQHAEQQFMAEGYRVFQTPSDEPGGAVALDRQGRTHRLPRVQGGL